MQEHTDNWQRLGEVLAGSDFLHGERRAPSPAPDDPAVIPGDDPGESAYLRVMRRKLAAEISSTNRPADAARTG